MAQLTNQSLTQSITQSTTQATIQLSNQPTASLLLESTKVSMINSSLTTFYDTLSLSPSSRNQTCSSCNNWELSLLDECKVLFVKNLSNSSLLTRENFDCKQLISPETESKLIVTLNENKKKEINRISNETSIKVKTLKQAYAGSIKASYALNATAISSIALMYGFIFLTDLTKIKLCVKKKQQYKVIGKTSRKKSLIEETFNRITKRVSLTCTEVLRLNDRYNDMFLNIECEIYKSMKSKKSHL